jgi:hypothetical protein
MNVLACHGIHEGGLAVFRGAIGDVTLCARRRSPGVLSLETV